MTLSCSETGGTQHPPLTSRVVELLEAVGFEYDCQLDPSEIDGDYPAFFLTEQYLGWEIQSAPFFSVIHIATGHTWVPMFRETEDTERVKFLIRKGVEQDLWKAMGGVR